MKNNIQTDDRNREVSKIQDTYNDDYWTKTYGVSPEELKETKDGDLSARIIQANIKNHSFQN
ncbi:MAG TPA: hypothetical protein VL490_09350 [Mucilaginibacter sp.]|jgi:hypothetical protein|nr:hypothetical protein [Mucilaginibacter sp.]